MPCTGESMGLSFGLDSPMLSPKRKFRWLFQLDGISASDPPGRAATSLPPRRGGRPSLSWKEYEFQHLNETIYYPFKPDWKPVQLHLLDVRCANNPVFDWIRYNAKLTSAGMYNPQAGTWQPIIDGGLKRNAKLIMLDGCGNICEAWQFDNCWPQNIDWGELDMDSSDIVTIDLTLRYDRAYLLVSPCGTNGGGGPTPSTPKFSTSAPPTGSPPPGFASRTPPANFVPGMAIQQPSGAVDTNLVPGQALRPNQE